MEILRLMFDSLYEGKSDKLSVSLGPRGRNIGK